MLFDLNEAWSRVEGAQYDVCICGTGPAGITAARKLSSLGKRVLLLEAGDLDFTAKSQEFYSGKSVGPHFLDLQGSRLRFFGGTSGHWAGRCGVLDDIDFSERAYFGLPGWPIPRQQVIAGLQETQDILDIGGASLSPTEDPQFESELFAQSGVALSPPTRFAEKYGDEIRRSDKIDCFYNANLIDLRLADNASLVEGFVVRNYNGRDVSASAKRYILALGGIENARILLNADRQMKVGVGNQNGMVGRCFMEHLNVPIGRFLVTDPAFWLQTRQIAPKETLLRDYNVGNGIVSFAPNANPQNAGRLRLLRRFLRETGCSTPKVTEIARKIVEFSCPGDGLINSLIEQAPNPDSRVDLVDDTDALGLRRVRINWQLLDRDHKTIRTLAIESAKEMARLDRARVKLAQFILDENREIEIIAHCHHMGTTRMSKDPRHGVVDENCKVHGVGNLFLAGSSVFPTGGGTNPTPTIVMLALRLAEFVGKYD